MVNSVKGTLIVHALLDPSMNLGDATLSQGRTVGSLNKQALVNRVKKLDDDVRLELMSELNHILLLLKNDPKVGPLRERGLCVVLLTHDGTAASERGFFDTICQMFKNFCGYSASSETIVEKITEVQAALAKGLQRHPHSLTIPQIKEALQTGVDAMHQEHNINETASTAKTAQLESLKTNLCGLWDLIPSETFERPEMTKFNNKIGDIDAFINQDAEMAGPFGGFQEKINGLISCINCVNEAKYGSLVGELTKYTVSLKESERDELALLNDATLFSQGQIAFLRKLVLSVAERNIKSFIDGINVEIDRENQINIKIPSLIELVRSRQNLLYKNELSNIASYNRNAACQEIAALTVQNEGASNTKDVLQRVCDSIDEVLNETNGTYEEFKKFVIGYVQCISYGTDKDLKNSHNYLRKLSYVSAVLKCEPHLLVEMVNSIELGKYLPLSQSDQAQIDLHTKLQLFVKRQLPLGTDEDRKALAIAYLKYMKLLFSAEKNVLSSQIAVRNDRIDLLGRTRPLELAALNPGVVAPAPQVNQAAVVVAPIQQLQVSLSPKDKLRVDALTLYHVYANNPSQAQGVCQQLKNESLCVYAENVYRNFYWLMKKNGKDKKAIVGDGAEAVFHAVNVTRRCSKCFPRRRQ